MPHMGNSRKTPKKNCNLRYVKVYNKLISEVGPVAALVYGELLSYENGSGGYAYPSIRTLCGNVGVGRNKIKAALNLLNSEGYIHAVGDELGRTVRYKCTDLNKELVKQPPRVRQQKSLL